MRADEEAVFAVGDAVWLLPSGPWTVTARYRNRSTGAVSYDLRYANGVVLQKVPADEVHRERKHFGYRSDQG
jgi:hypothetical protein